MLYSLKAVALAIFVACTAAATSEAEYQAAFTSWMQKHGKSYTSEEFSSRYIIFKSNFDYVNQWNANNEKTKLDTNFLADLTNEEYRRIYLGTKFDGSARLAANTEKSVGLLGIPASVDWNKKGAVTPIKNQAQCGSCWSFSTTGSVEGIHFIKTGNLVSCSEQQLVDCSGSYGNQGCNGGLMDNAFKYIIAVGGLDSESSYPYHATGGKCEFKKKDVVATITGYKDIPSGDENSLTNAIVQQPISVAIDASHQSFQLYSSGVYYEPDCSTDQLDHGVLAVGYGTDGSDAYYLVKNSWGASWGQEGFIEMARNKENNCGIATMASYPTA